MNVAFCFDKQEFVCKNGDLCLRLRAQRQVDPKIGDVQISVETKI